MSDPQHEFRSWVKEKLVERGHGAKSALAAFIGVRGDAITRMLNTDPSKETRSIKAHELQKMREFFTTPVEDEHLVPAGKVREVPVVGYVSAGAAHFFASSDGELDRVPAPDSATDETVAVEIRGESLGALFDQWLIFYDEVRSPVTSDLIGRLCVVALPDDRVLVKRIRRAKTPGFYHLESNTEGTIYDVEIVWAARVTNMSPR